MNSFSKSLRGFLLGTGLAIASLCAEAAQRQILFPQSAQKRLTSGGSKPLFRPVSVASSPSGSKHFFPSVGSTQSSTATGVVTIANGQVTGVTITNRGRYRYAPNEGRAWCSVELSGGGGSGATAQPVTDTIFDGSDIYLVVVAIQITNPGSGYTSPPTVTFVVKP